MTSFTDFIVVTNNTVSNEVLMQPADNDLDLSKLIFVPFPETRHLNSTFESNQPESIRINADHTWHSLSLDFSCIKSYEIKNYNTYFTIESMKGARIGDIVTIKYRNQTSGTPYGIVWPTDGSIEWIGGVPPTTPSHNNEVIIEFECTSFSGPNKFTEISREYLSPS